MRIEDLGVIAYRPAWALQEAAQAEVQAGGEERVFFVEHPPVITYGRRPGVERNIVAEQKRLAAMNVEVVASDRGGDVTFHGPGQLVVYPILRLADHGLTVSGYVHGLEQLIIDVLGEFGIDGFADRGAVGVWTKTAAAAQAEKIAAIGVRIRRGVSLHGLALNVTTDLRYFDLIVPCGLTGRRATSLAAVLGDAAPEMEQVKQAFVRQIRRRWTKVPAIA
jgi:lipoate-protein ligase B